MQLKLPKQLLDWIVASKGEVSPQSFIIDQLFLLKQTANQNEGVTDDTREARQHKT